MLTTPRTCCPHTLLVSYLLLRKKEKSVCKAPGATLAPPSFQSHLAFSLPMLSTGSSCLKLPTRDNSARAYINQYYYCFFPRQRRNAHLT
jgi:hypothetical protein